MAIQLRVWETTEGINIPYYQLPYTRAALNAAAGGTFPSINNQLNQYPNSNSGSLIGAPYRNDFLWIARQAFSGWNARAAIAPAPAGSFRFLTTEGVGGSLMSHSPGTIVWETLTNIERMNMAGGSTPPWAGIGPLQVRPFPSDMFAWEGAPPFVLPSAMMLTSDYRLIRVMFSPNTNAFGWQSWYFSISDVNESEFPDPRKMLSDPVKSSDDPEPDMARFNPRTATSTVGCYVLTKHKLRLFLRDLWTTNAIEAIQKAFIGDGSNALLGVKWFYGIKDLIEYGANEAFITLGNVGFNAVGADRPGKVPVAIKEFVTYDAGSVAVPQYYGDYRDWTITTYQIYLPFIGIVDLDARNVVGKTLYLKYVINISDGSAVCQLSTTPSTPNGTGLVFSTTCSWGYDIPVKVEPMLDALARTARMISGVVPVAGIGDLTSEGGSYAVGELSPNSNVMGDFQPKVIVHRKGDVSGAAFNAAEGQPSGATMTVGSASGYLKASTVYNAGTLPARHADEIVALLQEGIYI